MIELGTPRYTEYIAVIISREAIRIYQVSMCMYICVCISVCMYTSIEEKISSVQKRCQSCNYLGIPLTFAG